MLSIDHNNKRPAGLLAGGAFLCAEAWQSGLLHRAYPSADVWASNPLTASREFEPHRFHHQTSGADGVGALSTPDHQPRDLAPEKTIVPENIRLGGRYFQNRRRAVPQHEGFGPHEL